MITPMCVCVDNDLASVIVYNRLEYIIVICLIILARSNLYPRFEIYC